jgi:hypothetical protein
VAQRTCDVFSTSTSVCLRCDGNALDCSVDCNAVTSQAVSLTDVTCEASVDMTLFSSPLPVQPNSSGPFCKFEVTALGWMAQLGSGHSLAYFPALGGHCTGRNLATGVARTQWSCPSCTFVMEGWD